MMQRWSEQLTADAHRAAPPAWHTLSTHREAIPATMPHGTQKQGATRNHAPESVDAEPAMVNHNSPRRVTLMDRHTSTQTDNIMIRVAASETGAPIEAPSTLGRRVAMGSKQSSMVSRESTDNTTAKDSDEKLTPKPDASISTLSFYQLRVRTASNSKDSDGGSMNREPSISTMSLGHRVRAGSNDVDEKVKNIVSFESCEHLLRGSHLSMVMGKHAKIFSNSIGSASTYALSKPTKTIHAFISHNWVVSRWHKWAVLLVHFNTRIALFWTFVVLFPLAVVAARGGLPVVVLEFAPYPRTYIFRLIVFPIFLVILVYYRDISRCLFARDPIVFLDKTCIHQEDKAIQRQGIEKLGAFLCYSETMVICYTETYLKKLWTVYEVASFMTLQSVEQMRVVPVMFPVVWMVSLSFLWIAGGVALWPELLIGFYFTAQAACLLLAYGVLHVYRRWSRTKLEIQRTVSSFSARNCTCFCEEDRPLVYANIAALMRATQDIGKDASEEAALDCFDSLVRNNLYGALITSVGKYSMRYEQAAGVGVGFAAIVLDSVAGLAYGMSYRELWNYALWYAAVGLFALPCLLMGFSTVTDRCLQLRGWLENLYLAGAVVGLFVPMILAQLVLDLLEKWANASDVGFVVFILVVFTLSVLVRNAMNGTSCAQVCGSQTAKRPRREVSAWLQSKTPSYPGTLEPVCERTKETEVCENTDCNALLQIPAAENLQIKEQTALVTSESSQPPLCAPIGKTEVEQPQHVQLDEPDMAERRKMQLGAGGQMGCLATVESVNVSWGHNDAPRNLATRIEGDCRSPSDLLGGPGCLFVCSKTCIMNGTAQAGQGCNVGARFSAA